VVVEWVVRPGATVGSTSAPGVAPAPRDTAPVFPREAVPPPIVEAAPVTAAAPAPVSAKSPAVAERRSPLQHETVVHAKRIELVFDRESWVEIKDADGRIVFSQLNPPGSRRNVVGEAPFSIIIGNATGVKLRYNDADVDLAPFTRTDVARLTLK
jgi:cytoskeleton protein RodZ